MEDIIADWYSFQNIESIHKAFSEWFSIDLWKILRGGKLPNDDITLLSDALDTIIEFRHGIIHKYNLDRELSRHKIIKIFETTISIIEAFVSHIENLRGFPIREETVWAAEDAVDSKNSPQTNLPSRS